MQPDYDLVIVGAGMVGASLACALAETDLKIAIIEPVSFNHDKQPSYDDRGLALSMSSKRILDSLRVWDQLENYSTAIRKIHVSEQGKFGITRFNAETTGHSALGYVVVARMLGKALHQRLAEIENVDLICPASLKHFQEHDGFVSLEIVRDDMDGEPQFINTSLLVGADGNNSLTRRLAGLQVEENDFQQTAIVSNVTTQKDNRATAYERFTEHGPIALLPIDKNRAVLVFTVKTAQADKYLSMQDEDYIKQLESELGRRLGRITQLGQRRSYPIVHINALNQFKQGLVLLGNAAHTLHPNAAQGFNLGLRDVAGLSECIHDAIRKGQNLNDLSILERYQKLREEDQSNVISFTNNLAKTFYNHMPLLSQTRHFVLLLLDVMPGIKNSFMERAMGIYGIQPNVVRGAA